jgi:hypothetical protein
MGEDRQEFSRIVTDMSGAADPALMHAFSGSSAIGMEQVQYQSGDVLGFSGPGQEFEGFSGCDDMNSDREAIEALNQWQPNGMDFSRFGPLDDLDNYSINMSEPFGSIMR